jgi:hypothetical protein
MPVGTFSANTFGSSIDRRNITPNAGGFVTVFAQQKWPRRGCVAAIRGALRGRKKAGLNKSRSVLWFPDVAKTWCRSAEERKPNSAQDNNSEAGYFLQEAAAKTDTVPPASFCRCFYNYAVLLAGI